MKKETSATKFRRNPEYYLKELEKNAKRSKENNYYIKKGRREQIKIASLIRMNKAGYPPRKKMGRLGSSIFKEKSWW